MDWETWYLEVWLENHTYGEPVDPDAYRDWLFDKADLTLGED